MIAGSDVTEQVPMTRPSSEVRPPEMSAHFVTARESRTDTVHDISVISSGFVQHFAASSVLYAK